MPTFVIDPALCPLCKTSNACAVEAGKSQCWCMAEDLSVPRALIDLLPDELQGKACICETCVRQFLAVNQSE
ncbi:cysteine-rich CWC family protein [Thalassolituus sp.]|uniref:cysteine-rich CWC family protein n=1 Tax=Thalassolituus sp. TaxID=2030822 RepID=UPI002A83625C|nr:cysteine-rich CWC family protein [Thalassolituus sp.]